MAEETGLKFTMAPNPVRELIQVKLPDNKVYHLSIYNLTGEPLQKHKLQAGTHQLDVSSLSPGIYIVKAIQPATGLYRVRKLMVR